LDTNQEQRFLGTHQELDGFAGISENALGANDPGNVATCAWQTTRRRQEDPRHSCDDGFPRSQKHQEQARDDQDLFAEIQNQFSHLVMLPNSYYHGKINRYTLSGSRLGARIVRVCCTKQTTLHLADLLLDHQSVSALAQDHVTSCAHSASELASMESTMRLLDQWQAPDPGAFFDARLGVRLRMEKASARAGFLERLRARVLYSSALHVRPWATEAAVTLLIIGAGTPALLNNQTQPVETSVALRDLQWYDGNVQVIQQLSSLDSDDENSTLALNSHRAVSLD
jgi:hypothetical protein